MKPQLRHAPEDAQAPDWAALDTLGLGRWEADPSMVRVHVVTPAIERMLRIPGERWSDEPGLWLARVHPSDKPEVLRLRAAHEGHVAEYRFLSGDGRFVWLRESVRYERDAHGGVGRLVGVVQDITAQRRSGAHLAAQAALASVLASARSLEEAGEDILRAVGVPLGHDVAALWRHDSLDGLLHCEAVWVSEHVNAASFRSLTRDSTFAPGVGLPGRVLQTGRVAWVTDVVRDSNFPQAAEAAREGLRTGVAIPIRSGGATYGVLEHYTRETRPPDEDALLLLESIGTQLAQFEERRLAQAEAQDLGIRRGAILEAALDAIITIDASGCVVEWNAAAERTFGYTREEAIGRVMGDLIVPPEQRERYHAGLARHVRTGDAKVLGQRLELPAIRKDGTRFPAEIAIVRIPVAGAPLFTGHIRDISARKGAERALRESEARYRFLADTVPQQVWTAQPGGTIDYANRRAAAYFGAAPEEAGWDVLVHPEDLPRLHETWGGARASGEPFEIELRLRRHDGAHRWHILRAHPLKGASDIVLRWFGSSTDIEEKKRQEARLGSLLREVEDQRQRLDETVASVPGVVWDAWSQGPGSAQKMGFVSEHAVQMLGYPLEAWRETPDFWLEIVHEEDRERVRAEAAQLFSRGDTGTLRFRWVREDGTSLWVQSWNAVAKDPLGRPVGLRGVTLDVTQLKEAEDALRASDERFRLLARATSDTVWDLDLATDTMWWNENLTTMFGYAPGELEPTHEAWESRVHPEDLPRVRAGRLAAIDMGEPTWQDEYRFRRRDGTYAAILDRGFIIRGADGQAVRIVGSMMDVTARRLAEQALRESQAALAKAQEIAHLGSWSWDTVGGLMDWSDEQCRLHGLPAGSRPDFDEFLGCVHTDDRGIVAEAFQHVLEHGQAGDVVYRIVRPDGGERHLQTRGEAERDQDGRVVRIFGTSLDVTESRLAERALRQRAEELARLTEALSRSNSELDQFAYVTSHDLKAPLRGIANLSLWIEEDIGEKLSEESKAHLDLLRGRVHRMEALIDAILEYSRVGRVRAKPEEVDVGQLVAEVVDLLAPPEGFAVEVSQPMPVVVTERMRLQQVFLNLIGNAIKHHHRKSRGRVRIAAEDAGRLWRFRVEDDGPGISPRFHEKIFVVFQTLEPRDKVEGTGIGLAIVKKIVESFGGTISVESDEGRGSTFEFTWPK